MNPLYEGKVPAGPWTLEKARAYCRLWRKDNRELMRKLRREYEERNLDDVRARRRKSQKAYAAANPEKIKAQQSLNQAVAIGRVVRPDKCDHCSGTPNKGRDGRSGIQAHHHKGYDFPFDVEWLCSTCHSLLHNGVSL